MVKEMNEKTSEEHLALQKRCIYITPKSSY